MDDAATAATQPVTNNRQFLLRLNTVQPPEVGEVETRLSRCGSGICSSGWMRITFLASLLPLESYS
jgi:hypothetical protein